MTLPNCPTFAIFATIECDGREYDFTFDAQHVLLGIIPQSIFLIAVLFRFGALAPRDDMAFPGFTQVLKLITAVVYVVLQSMVIVAWSLLKVYRTKSSLALETVELIATLMVPALVLIESWKSARPSTLNCLYFGITAIFDIIYIRSMFTAGYDSDLTDIFIARAVCKLWMCGLECVSKRGSLTEEYKSLSPEATAGILNRSFQFWLIGLFRRGFRGELKLDDLFSLDPDMKAEVLGNRFKASWLSRLRPERRFELVYAILGTFWFELAGAAIPRVFNIGFTFAQVFLISRVLTLLEEPLTQRNQIIGFFLIGAAAVIYLGLAITKLFYNQKMYRFVTKFRGAMVCAIYDHLLVLGDTDGNKEATLTLMSVDIDRIAAALPELNETWSQAIEVIVGITLLSLQLGWVSVMPVFLVIVAFLGGAQITRTIGDKQKIWIDAVQVRVTFTSAILAGMKNIKMLGLSNVVQAFVQQYRIDETIHMAAFRWSILWQNVVQNIPWALTPAFTFAIYAGQAVARGQGSIDTVKAFSSLAIIHLLTDPTAKLVSSIPSAASTLGCFERIQQFLLIKAKKEQRNFHPLPADPLNEFPDSFTSRIFGPTLTWLDISHIPTSPIVHADQLSIRPAPGADVLLSDVSFNIPPKSFTAVVGPVGSGKTTLLKALLGELLIEQGGELRLAQCSTSYCAQTPWLPNTTVREAIIGPTARCDDHYDPTYENAIAESALEHDIERWEKGDKTMTGPNGSLLSGGQQQRVALARVLYVRPTLIVLDDVFAALDLATQRTVFKSLFKLRRDFPDKAMTVVFATSNVELLKYADQVLLIKDGTIEKTVVEDRAILDLANTTAAAQRQAANTISLRAASTDDETLQQARQIDDLARSTGDLSVYKYYSRHVNKFHGLVFLVFAAVNIFSYSFAQIWIKWWTDAGGAQIALYISVLIGLALLNSTSTGIYIWAMVIEIAPSTARKFHDILLRTVMRAPQALFAKTDNGVLLNRFTQDMSIIEGQLATGVLVSITNLFSAVAAAALVATGSSYMALSIPVLVLTIWGLQNVYLRTSRQLRILEIEYKSPLYTHFAETASGLMTIRTFEWQEAFQKKNVELLNQSQQSYYLLFCVQRWLSLVLDLIVAAEAVLVIGLAVGIRGSTSSGLLGVSLTNVLSFSAALSNFLSGWTMLETSLGSIARLMGFEEAVKPEDRPGETHKPLVQWPARGQVEFKNVTALYDDNESGLRDINLKITEGQIVGICGRTGSGKSSLIATLLRLVEITSGTVSIDGVDIATLPRQFLREQIIVATQHPLIMPATLRLNLDPERRKTDAEMIRVLDLLELTPLAQRLGGLSGDVRVDGLSKGEQLLISLARLVLSKRHEHGLLLLDEVTSSLDFDTETTVQRVIRQHFGLYTKIVVAHRLHTIIDSDIVVLMNDGRIAESGPPRKLLGDPNSRFSQLLQSQL